MKGEMRDDLGSKLIFSDKPKNMEKQFPFCYTYGIQTSMGRNLGLNSEPKINTIYHYRNFGQIS